MSETPWSSHRFIFIGGMHRSGTTLVADILGASPQSSGLTNTGVGMNEGVHLQKVYPRSNYGVGGFALEPRVHLTEREAVTIPGAAERLWNAWSPYWDLSRPHLVEKSPANLLKTRFFRALYPGSRFIVVTRHPVIQAMAVRKWVSLQRGRLGYGFPRLIENWVRAHDILAADSRDVDDILVVRYEHLMKNPQKELSRIEEFLGITLPADQTTQVKGGRSDDYASRWESPGLRLLPDRLRADLGAADGRPKKIAEYLVRDVAEAFLHPHYKRVVGERFGDRIRAHGYDLDVLDDAAD